MPKTLTSLLIKWSIPQKHRSDIAAHVRSRVTAMKCFDNGLVISFQNGVITHVIHPPIAGPMHIIEMGPEHDLCQIGTDIIIDGKVLTTANASDAAQKYVAEYMSQRRLMYSTSLKGESLHIYLRSRDNHGIQVDEYKY